MSQTATRSRTDIPFPGTTTQTRSTTPTTTKAEESGRRQRIAHLFRRRHREQQSAYRPRRVDVEPFEHGTVDWWRMLMSMQRLT